MKSNSSQRLRLIFSFVLLIAPFLFPSVLFCQPAETGVITGRVSNAATLANLEGAVVRVEGLESSTITERDGTYRLSLPAGNYSLIAAYTGLDDQTALATVKPGATVTRDIALTSTVYRMEKMVVAGE